MVDRVREYEDFTFIADKFAQKLIDQNIIYAETFDSPGDFARYGLEPQRLTEAISKGLQKNRDRVTVNLVADLIRDFGPEKGEQWLKAINEVRGLGVVGIGIGGSAQSFPPEPCEKVYEQARHPGFKTSAHVTPDQTLYGPRYPGIGQHGRYRNVQYNPGR